MIAQSFLLAVPQHRQVDGTITICSAFDRLRRDRPCLWLGPGTRSMPLACGGHVIGALFRGGRTCLAHELEQLPHAGRPAASRAGWFARECWGAYAAFGSDPDGSGIWAFPDPSGLLPVYRLATPGHILLASDPRLFTRSGAASPLISWTALADHLRYPELRQEQTCLAGITELSPGMLHTLAEPAGSPLAIWRPETFLPAATPLPAAEAVAALRSCAIETLGAWAAHAGPVAVAASGGVDSSLICAALAVAGRKFDCITIATADPSGDERRFAALLGTHLGVRVETAIYDPGDAALTTTASAGLPRPSRRLFMKALDAACDRARQKLGAMAVFDGNSGDNLFCFLHSAAPVTDRLAAEGLGPALRTLRDMCHVTGSDAATMARAAWRRWRRGPQRRPWSPDNRLLAPAVLADRAITPMSPWLDECAGAPSGKLDHLALVLRGQNHLHGLGQAGAARFSPLASQPLLELCLGIPTWLWCTGGINRAIARQAFAPELPPAILRRRSKAGPDSFIRQLFTANRVELRSLLLDGLLAGQGLIDPAATEAALRTDALSGDAMANRLLDLAEAELWARSWSR